MAKVIYSGVSNKARKIKSCYVGVTDKARKITKAYIGVNNIARLCYSSDMYPVGTYWLIDSSGTKCYSSSGALISSNSITTSWTCMVDGYYSIELHAYGGTGGKGYIYLNFKLLTSTGDASSGGGGGGSGAIWYNAYLQRVEYPIHLAASKTDITRFNESKYINYYEVASGGDGGNGGDALSGTGGTSGGRGAFSPSSGTLLASSGAAGNSTNAYRNDYSGIKQLTVNALAGGAGGSGGSTIGSYGSGGSGSGTPSYTVWQNYSYSKEYYDYSSGQPGAIIIRRTG